MEEIEFLNSLKSKMNIGAPINDLKTLINQRKITLTKQLNLCDVTRTLQWIDAETERPSEKQAIIFIDNVGMFKGVFRTTKNGQVIVDGNSKDIIDWEDVHEWVNYPEH
ncbi:hypothetical protein OD91_0868 [Lutibacter sp. Hel_I_33_5]|uniref:hypothetical protein n=1 Tax=Lutibacter sp. Hel_I_33_5 TaxID=1566289 RepID=UPI0011A75E19|nr:hypothetical protein [Lutibacter sp. Hel_I_33_5]TVZ55613.1 hypothetical protein OD91_0868 [Lutibacter sp. Hel_I_33_5]